jgi:serine/threonine-protein kinase RsbW
MRTESRIKAGTPNTVELKFGARPENLALARLALAGVGAVAGASDAVVADLKLAVTEACTNAIQHAYHPGSDHRTTVSVRYRIDGGTLEVEVEDDGRGFDPDDPGAGSLENGDNQGMGLMIIRSLTDEVEIESDDSGSRIAFVKRVGHS